MNKPLTGERKNPRYNMEAYRDLRLSLRDLQTRFDLRLGRTEIPKGRFLQRLSFEDQAWLGTFTNSCLTIMREEGRRGVLFAVGGALYKRPLPRKDIDVVLLFSGIFPDYGVGQRPHWEAFSSLVERSVRQLGIDCEINALPPSRIFDYWLNGGRILIRSKDGSRPTIDVIDLNVEYDFDWRRHPEPGKPFSVLAELRGEASKS